jgi:hypothetical protein
MSCIVVYYYTTSNVQVTNKPPFSNQVTDIEQQLVRVDEGPTQGNNTAALYSLNFAGADAQVVSTTAPFQVTALAKKL